MKNNKEELVNYYLELLMIIKVYHWKTKSYSEHKATDELYETLNSNFDKFVEVMLGKDDSKLKMKGKTIKFTDPSNKKDLKKIISSYKKLLEKSMNKYINIVKDTDLLSIRDDILANLNQFLFLLALK